MFTQPKTMTSLTRLFRHFKSAGLLPLFLCVAAQAKGADAQTPSKLPAPPPIPAPAHSAQPLPDNTAIEKGAFSGSTESLLTYRAPDWFRDAKLGIWSHWGPPAVTQRGWDWYARKIYIQDSPEYRFHLDHYGHPSAFGYKDFIQLWKAERFDPERLMDLYAKTGAKYFVTIAAHHDNFDLWNSRYHAWNAVNYGPHQDIVGRWRDAARKRGLRFGMSEHFSRTYSWFNTCHDSDKTGPYAGVPYDGNDPRFRELYNEPHEDSRVYYPVNAPESVAREWFWRMRDLIDSYEPDFLYSDGAIPFGQVGRDLIASFYNHSMANHSGSNQAVYTIKKVRFHGEFLEGAAVRSVERGRLDGISPEPWQCENSIGPWFYKDGIDWKTIGNRTILEFVDIVSKNGNLLLNLPQRPDGTLDPGGEEFLVTLARWNSVNGEGIFGSRPWVIFGEDDPAAPAPTPSKDPNVKTKKRAWTTPQDLRFTRSADGSTLYVFCLGVPSKPVHVRSLGTNAKHLAGSITRVRMLGSDAAVEWKCDPESLVLTLPAGSTMPPGPAVGFAISVKP